MITVLIPVYNEEKVIEKTLTKLTNFMGLYSKRYEVLIVDDGSSDKTLGIVKKVSKMNKKVRILKHTKNLGIGAALRTGLKGSKGDIIITMDSDLTYPPEEIPKLVNALVENDADMVIGTPYISGGDWKAMPFIRFFLSRCVNLMDQVLFGLNFTTPTSFFRAWKKELAKSIEINFDRFEAVSESAITAHRNGFTVVEVPVKYGYTADRKSKLKIFSTIKNHLEMDFKLLLHRN